MPTMMRKAKKSGATGGCSANASSPLISAFASCARISEPARGTLRAKSVRLVSSFGMPMRVSGTPFSVLQIASSAAIFAAGA